MQRKLRKPLGIVVPVLVALVLVLLTAALVTANSGITASAGESGQIPEGTEALLYDQTSNASGNGAPDQDFEAAFNAYDSEAADDFVVPAGENWLVDRIVTVGTQSTGGTPTSVDVWFYADDAGFPAATATCSYADLATVSTASLDVTLPAPCSLAAGTWWVAIQTNQNFGGGNGQHFWSNRTVASNSGAVWRNPGNGFGTGCVDWDRMTTCGVGGGVSPDFLFQIHGTIGEPPVTSIALTKTVDEDPANACAGSNNITVPAGYGGTEVTYCYTMENTGDLTVTYHTVEDSELGTVLGPDFMLDVGPGDTVAITATALITETTVNTATWYINDAAGAVITSSTDVATVTRGDPTDVSLSSFGADKGVDASLLALGALLVVVTGLGLAMRRKVTN